MGLFCICSQIYLQLSLMVIDLIFGKISLSLRT
jgi:hypothetical protein